MEPWFPGKDINGDPPPPAHTHTHKSRSPMREVLLLGGEGESEGVRGVRKDKGQVGESGGGQPPHPSSLSFSTMIQNPFHKDTHTHGHTHTWIHTHAHTYQIAPKFKPDQIQWFCGYFWLISVSKLCCFRLLPLPSPITMCLISYAGHLFWEGGGTNWMMDTKKWRAIIRNYFVPNFLAPVKVVLTSMILLLII